MERVDNVADTLFVEQRNLSRRERDEVTLRNHEPASVGQTNRERTKSVGQPFPDIVDDHVRTVCWLMPSVKAGPLAFAVHLSIHIGPCAEHTAEDDFLGFPDQRHGHRHGQQAEKENDQPAAAFNKE